jgi:THO complex subunit 7
MPTRRQMLNVRRGLEQLVEEAREYEEEEQRIVRETAEAEANITRLQQDLVKYREIRRQKEDYEALAALVNQYPAKAASERAAQELKEDIERMEQEKKKLESTLEFRKKQVGFILQTITSLSAGLELDQATDRDDDAYRAAREEAQAEAQEGNDVDNEATDMHT